MGRQRAERALNLGSNRGTQSLFKKRVHTQSGQFLSTVAALPPGKSNILPAATAKGNFRASNPN